jgi:hypothetical protein
MLRDGAQQEIKCVNLFTLAEQKQSKTSQIAGFENINLVPRAWQLACQCAGVCLRICRNY